mmetsp:Transcript_32640/g.75102  ORF Transcript_32640/g.75102 Transcript_32640/m.75102 type:complete len:235 (-) Transcript_32640:75-779(-)
MERSAAGGLVPITLNEAIGPPGQAPELWLQSIHPETTALGTLSFVRLAPVTVSRAHVRHVVLFHATMQIEKTTTVATVRVVRRLNEHMNFWILPFRTMSAHGIVLGNELARQASFSHFGESPKVLKNGQRVQSQFPPLVQVVSRTHEALPVGTTRENQHGQKFPSVLIVFLGDEFGDFSRLGVFLGGHFETAATTRTSTRIHVGIDLRISVETRVKFIQSILSHFCCFRIRAHG